jgi:hypothetical protein
MVQAAANYMSVFIYANKRTYTQTLRIHCPTSPRGHQAGGGVGRHRPTVTLAARLTSARFDANEEAWSLP